MSRFTASDAVPRFAEVTHRQWIAAAPETVRAQFADLEHHIRANVHPKLRFELLERRGACARFVQEVRLLGLRQRDVFERSIGDDGSIDDVSVEEFNRGGRISIRFAPERVDGVAGTSVAINVKLPLPPVIGALVRPLLEAQIRKEVRAAALEDKADLEERGYPSRLRGAAAACGGRSRLRWPRRTSTW